LELRPLLARAAVPAVPADAADAAVVAVAAVVAAAAADAAFAGAVPWMPGTFVSHARPALCFFGPTQQVACRETSMLSRTWVSTY